MTILENIHRIVEYGLKTKLIEAEDQIYIINQMLALFQIDNWEENKTQVEVAYSDLEEILNEMTDYAMKTGILPEDNILQRDLFDTKIMGILTPRPSEIITRFRKKYQESPKEATEYFYQLSQDSDYIRRYRISKDLKWTAQTEYGTLDITVNLSKPEKDPKAIAAARNAKQSGYPKCLLCKENEGYAGRINHPARQNLRIIPLEIQKSEWGFQYSPYVYYNEHCIIFNAKHIPMQINHDTFCKLVDFVKQFPHYFLGSNADLPIVGGSILTHDHFQGGNYEFAMAKAPIERTFSVKGMEDIEAGIVKWPMSVIRLKSENTERLIMLADKILSAWREYTDESSFIYAYTDDIPHNTVTPIARKVHDKYELDLVLRNNITTPEHPMGIYHPHKELHHIKKENIGLIEVMGLAVLPARLKDEMKEIEEALLSNQKIEEMSNISKHAAWVEKIQKKYDKLEKNNIQSILQKEIGLVFQQVLEDAGVFKRNTAGENAFWRFIESFSNK